LAQAIVHLATHPEEALEMGARGRDAVALRFNWPTEIQGYVVAVCA